MSFERKAKYHTLSCMKQTISSKKKKKSSVICTVEDCKLNVRSRKLLVKHFREAHAELVPSNSCSVCSKTFKDRSNYKKHLLAHRGQMDKECPICKKKFWKYYLPKHIKRNHTHNHILTNCYSNNWWNYSDSFWFWTIKRVGRKASVRQGENEYGGSHHHGVGRHAE